MPTHPISLISILVLSLQSQHLNNDNTMNELEEEDYIIVKWVQENVETLYNLLNK
jgi:hypothetical protein